MLSQNKFERFFDKILNLLFYLSGSIVAFIAISVCYNVFMRYFFKSPPLWVVQATEYSLLWIVFLSASFLLREKGHISIDIMYSRLKGKKKEVVDFAIYLICVFFMGIFTFFSLMYFLECLSSNVTDVRTYTVKKWVLFLVVPLGAFFLTIQFLRFLVEKIKKLWSGTTR